MSKSSARNYLPNIGIRTVDYCGLVTVDYYMEDGLLTELCFETCAAHCRSRNWLWQHSTPQYRLNNALNGNTTLNCVVDVVAVRDAIGVEGVGNGEAYPLPSPSDQGSGERRELSQRGKGPKINLVHFIWHRTLQVEGNSIYGQNFDFSVLY